MNRLASQFAGRPFPFEILGPCPAQLRSRRLFRHRTRRDLYCVVPDGGSLPAIMEGRTWELVRQAGAGSLLPGFSESAARLAFGLQGFYAFRAVPLEAAA